MDFKLLSKYRISYPKFQVAGSREEAISSAEKIGFPVAMKIASPSVLHKSDKGGVLLGITDGKAAASAYDFLMAKFSGVKIDGVLIQEMEGKGAVELILGGKKDAQFGQMIMLGLGGIYVEIFRDFSLRVCPITKNDAEEMIRELRAYPMLSGARGKKPINKEALVSTMLKVSDLLVKENPSEFDLNPLMADEKGCVAVDMRILK